MVGVSFENFTLGARKCGFHRLHLMQDINAVAVLFDHARDAPRLAFYAMQTLNDGGGIRHFPHPLTYTPMGYT